MVGIIAILAFLLYLYYDKTRGGWIDKSEATEADTGWESEEGSREDYLRAYQSESQREPYGNGQDFDGGRVSLRPWHEN